jgi:ribosomal protein L19
MCFGCDKIKILTPPPQPINYLYYMRLRNDKKRNNGCDKIKILTTPTQPINYLYYMRLRNDKKRNN